MTGAGLACGMEAGFASTIGAGFACGMGAGFACEIGAGFACKIGSASISAAKAANFCAKLLDFTSSLTMGAYGLG